MRREESTVAKSGQPQKIGFYSLRHTAYKLCKFLFKFGPVIRLWYPENTTLLAALALAETACHELVEELDKEMADTDT